MRRTRTGDRKATSRCSTSTTPSKPSSRTIRPASTPDTAGIRSSTSTAGSTGTIATNPTSSRPGPRRPPFGGSRKTPNPLRFSSGWISSIPTNPGTRRNTWCGGTIRITKDRPCSIRTTDRPPPTRRRNSTTCGPTTRRKRSSWTGTSARSCGRSTTWTCGTTPSWPSCRTTACPSANTPGPGNPTFRKTTTGTGPFTPKSATSC